MYIRIYMYISCKISSHTFVGKKQLKSCRDKKARHRS